MFDSLSDKLQNVFENLARRGKLSEADFDTVLREVRIALLEADVNFTVVKDFLARVKQRGLGMEIMKSMTPAQAVLSIVYEELLTTLGEPGTLNLGAQSPAILMLVGLQGSGKTTTAAKLALHLRKHGSRPLLVAADTHRPAAIDQLQVLGRQLDMPVWAEGDKVPPPDICMHAVQQARQQGKTVVILDTAGRLHIDEEMMREVEAIKARVKPIEVLLVVDAMTGQDAVRVAGDFHKRLGLTGIVMTKIDGDTRGGAAISVRQVTSVPIKFLGESEKLDGLSVFQPDRLAQRILGMGDIQTLAEVAQEHIDQEQAEEMAKKLRDAKFDLDDFLKQLRQVKKMGPITQFLEMIPGFNRMAGDIDLSSTDKDLRRIEAMISSMTAEERHNPRILNASRKRRIARGSGTTVQEINILLKQFRQMQTLMQQLAHNRGRGNPLANLFR